MPVQNHSECEAYMPEDNPAKKSFEASAKTAREAMDRGSAAAEQAARQVEQSIRCGRHCGT